MRAATPVLFTGIAFVPEIAACTARAGYCVNFSEPLTSGAVLNGTFNMALSPRVEVCATGGGCLTAVRQLDNADQYHFRTPQLAAGQYTITVYVDTVEISTIVVDKRGNNSLQVKFVILQ